MPCDEYVSPWKPGWREAIQGRLDRKWDIIIVGGGITGAGILAIASKSGMKTLLLEKEDFSSGTSSRSSKLVHGGLRYLKHMHIKLTRDSVRERQRMLREAQGLVEPLGFIYPLYHGDKPSPWLVEIGLGVYTHLSSDAGEYTRLDSVDLTMLAPGLKQRGLEQGYYYTDARTDDARLVLRVIHDGLLWGKSRCAALNYCQVTGLLEKNERVVGVRIRDERRGEEAEIKGSVVINATGAWSDRLRSEVGGRPRLRPIRGSHLFFSRRRFPVYQAVAFTHPEDRRPVFVFPWEGITLVGTTDVDHHQSLDTQPSISEEEAEYLLQAVRFYFPELSLSRSDVLTTQAGVRPVVATGEKDPSAESREHTLWNDKGLLTVTGGKLTTFRVIALDALREAHNINKSLNEPHTRASVFSRVSPSPLPGVDPFFSQRLYGRYGAAAPSIIKENPHLLSKAGKTPYLWAEIAWSLENEAVEHLDDLLLRRFRLGILLEDGGQELFPQLKKLCKERLGWQEVRWVEEKERFQKIWQEGYLPPPSWRS